MSKKPEFNETTSFQQLRGTLDFLNTHIQLIDASLIKSIKELRKETDQDKDINEALGVNKSDYAKLNHPVKQHPAIFKHTQNKNIEYAMIQLYNSFTHYLQSIVKEMFAKQPMLIVGKAVVNNKGEDKEGLTIKYAEVIKLGSYEAIQEEIVRKVFRSIEELRSTKKLLDRILSDTKVNIAKNKIEDALIYLEMRHLFIHGKGLVDDKYEKSYGDKFQPKLKKGDKLPKTFPTFEKALTSIFELCRLIDQELIRTGLIEKRKFKGTVGTAPNIVHVP